ncbi:hypothetical protein JG687_00007448 [Phytophthora cactorum]|uniref:RxLR effector protein n=1 Tax=Phytophthora cactorum TaxID=29920 RepID=A0A329RWC5_9STRA|nr:hypothetical protein Pcac1_g6439 [Phytophthora cactorum]KAG2802761.1 hypothetical protein PC111_g18960 [Phytophthora cactorum]KAG2805862.1 hypothetical protein PC112_g18083 [Phytophthora cactorum]KAG2856765.1 hypothetical protein PC113_g11282 [Phytophthora cactorum]KAG2891800.1 hypothetical protein PC114_g16857 [Phytophthora cactorum]
MRWHCFLVISLVGLSFAFSLSVRHPGQISIDPLSGPANKPPVFSSRALRSYDEPENDNTDIGDSVSEARVRSSLKSALYDLAYKLALKLDMDPTVVYNLLRVAKAGGKLDNNNKKSSDGFST